MCSSTSSVSSVAGPRPSNCRTTADSAERPIQKPPPSSPSRYPQPPARAACPAPFRPYAIDPVPATTTTPGSSPAPATSATSASLTTSVCVLKPMRRMMPRTASASAGRSTPAIPRQIAAGRTSGASGCCESAASMTWCSTFSTSSSPADCRFAPPPRASAITVPASSASRHTVFVPPASIPSTCIAVLWYRFRV